MRTLNTINAVLTVPSTVSSACGYDVILIFTWIFGPAFFLQLCGLSEGRGIGHNELRFVDQ